MSEKLEEAAQPPPDVVVPFTGKWRGRKRPPRTETESDEVMLGLVHYHAQRVLDAATSELFCVLDVAGIDVEESDGKDVALMMESVRSLILKKLGAAHPFQNLANSAFVPEKYEGEDVLKLQDHVSVDLKMAVAASD